MSTLSTYSILSKPVFTDHIPLTFSFSVFKICQLTPVIGLKLLQLGDIKTVFQLESFAYSDVESEIKSIFCDLNTFFRLHQRKNTELCYMLQSS